ncbi:unnamed protein product [Auanema sp. JU1783]|nr:unnamed protein product [Auanema sp. JU1783]
MLTGIYDYIFGSEDSNDATVAKENMIPSSCKDDAFTADDWYLVDDLASGRSSPVLIPNPDIRDIDSLSFSSRKQSPPPTADQIKRAEALKQARALAAQRLQLERMLFADVESPLTLQAPTKKSSGTTELLSAGKMKRAVAASHVNSDTKTKSRSKKAGKMSSGRNNDRKCNNLA